MRGVALGRRQRRVGGLILTCAPKRDWGSSNENRMSRNCKGMPGKPNIRARWVAKDFKTDAKPELYAPTPPLEALKMVLSEIATSERVREVVALVDVRKAYFHAPSRRIVFLELPPRTIGCGLLQHRLYGARDALRILRSLLRH